MCGSQLNLIHRNAAQDSGWYQWLVSKIVDTETSCPMRETLIPELEDPEALQAVTEAVLALLDRWGVESVNQAALLGLPDISALRRGSPLAKEPSVLERAGHLLAIDRALQTLHPYTPTSRDRWISLPQAGFDSRSALALMLEEGVEGIKTVRHFLESEIH